MNNNMFVVMALMLVFSVGFVSADTLIAGKIYNSDYTSTVDGADVIVSCDNGVSTVSMNTTSLADGSYAVEFLEDNSSLSYCENGNTLTVSASHPSHGFGSNSGVINDDVIGTWDVGIVNVPLVPEFGFVVGMLTMISAVGIFFVVRRE